MIEKLNEYLQTLVSSSSYELRLEPNKNPYIVSVNGQSDISTEPLPGPQISMMVFPLIPDDVRIQLPTSQEIQFVHPHNLGKFTFTVAKSPGGFVVAVRPVGVDPNAGQEPVSDHSGPKPETLAVPEPPVFQFEIESSSAGMASTQQVAASSVLPDLIIEENFDLPMIEAPAGAPIDVVDVNDPQFQTVFSDASTYEPPIRRQEFESEPVTFEPPAPPHESNFVPPPAVYTPPPPAEVFAPTSPDADRREYVDRRQKNSIMAARMDAMFHRMAEVGASDLHLSVSVRPMIRKDGKMQQMECAEDVLSPEIMSELLQSIMPERNIAEFVERNDSDFAYEIPGLARFRCNIFKDRKGMGGVFRIIPSKILTAEQLALSKAIMDLCSLSKGLVVVTGPTGSGKSTTLCAMVDSINKTREDHIITIEDPIEFVHDNQKCLVNQREVHNHTDSFKDALRAALREDPDILLVGEMRDLETISIAIETAETGHLVFGTLHTTTAASTIDRIIDQFPADRQQQIRVMLSESLKGVIAQTLLPKKGGGRVAALEVLIVTPAISNLIREGKTFQIPSAMQTGKNLGMVMLNDALFEHVKNGVVEPRDAYIKAVDKAGFETMLTRGGFKL
ncbi:MAG: type IV pilus twitching motility protein PilT [Pyrinomonadaceae bacterium]